MEPADKLEITIAAVIAGVYIAFILTRQVCGTIPGFCKTGWIVFGVVVAGAIMFLRNKVFK